MDVIGQILRLVGQWPDMRCADAALLERFTRERDEKAFEELLARHGPLVWSVVRHRLDKTHDAEDAFAATWLVFVRKAASIRKRSGLASWLYGVAHKVASRARAEATRRRARESEGVEVMTARIQPGPEDRELMRLLHEELGSLPKSYRLPLMLFHLEGLTQEQVAQELGCTPGAVKGRLERGRERLRDRLARRGVVLSAGALTSALGQQTLQAVVPAALLAATLRITGLGLAVGAGTRDILAPSVASLATGVIYTMFMTKVKIAAALVLVGALLTTGVGMAAYQRSRAQEQALTKAEPPPAETAKQPKAGEQFEAEVFRIANGAVTFHQRPADRSVPEPFEARLTETTLPLIPNAKILRASFKDRKLLPGEPLPDGLRNEQLLNLDPRATRAWIITDDKGKAIQEMWITPPAAVRMPGPLERAPASADVPDGDALPAHAVARLGSLRFRHTGNIEATAVSPDGHVLASGGSGSIQLWNAESGASLFRLQVSGRYGPDCLAFSQDGRRLAAYEHGGRLQMIGVDTGTVLKKVDLSRLAARTASVRYYLAFVPDGKQMLLYESDEPEVVHLFDAESGAEIRGLHGAGPRLSAIALAPDGQTLSLACERAPVQILNIATGKKRLELKNPPDHCWALAFSPDSKTLASATNDVYLWDAGNGALLHTLAPRVSVPARPGNGGAEARPPREIPAGLVRSLSFSPDGKQLAAMHGSFLMLWDPATGKELRRWVQPTDSSVRFLPDGHTLLVGAGLGRNQGSFSFFDTATGQPARRFEGHNGEIKAIAYSPDGKFIATADAGQLGAIRIWDAKTHQVLWRSTRQGGGGASLLAFSPKGDAIAADITSGTFSQIIGVWDLETGALRQTLPAPMRFTRLALAFSHYGKRLAVGAMDGCVRLFDLANGKTLQDLRVMEPQASTMAFSQDLHLVACAMQKERTIRLWDLTTGREWKTMPQSGTGMVRLAFSPDGCTLLEISGAGKVILWEVATGQQRQVITLKELVAAWQPRQALRTLPVDCAAFSRDGRFLALTDASRLRPRGLD